MSISELNWFIDLAKSHPTAPNETQKLAEKISRALSSDHVGTQLNRAFNNKSVAIQITYTWLGDKDIRVAVKNKQCQITSDAYDQTLIAFNSILNGVLPSKAWSMTSQMGPNTSFTKTLEANALAQYLATNEILNYSARKAAAIASEVLGINVDEIRQYDQVEPIDYKSMCAIAYSAVMRYGDLGKADKYFDADELCTDATLVVQEESSDSKL